jgi:hypothetical protein
MDTISIVKGMTMVLGPGTAERGREFHPLSHLMKVRKPPSLAYLDNLPYSTKGEIGKADGFSCPKTLVSDLGQKMGETQRDSPDVSTSVQWMWEFHPPARSCVSLPPPFYSVF